MNEFAKWKLGLAVWFGTLLFLLLSAVIFYANISAEAKVAIAMALATAFTTIIYAYWRKTSAEEKVNPTDESPKADSPVTGDPTGNMGAVQGLGESCTSSSATADFTLSDAPNVKVDKTIDSIFDDLKADGIKQTTAAVASRIVSYLGAHESELTNSEKAGLLDYGVGIAQMAYEEITGLVAPEKYSEVADYNKWWRENQKACKAPKGDARAILMTLRDLLKRAGL